jgi:subtilisin
MLLAIVFALSAIPLSSSAATAQAQEAEPPVAGSQVIVVLDDGDDPVAAAQDMGIAVTHIYRHVFTGFSGTVLPGSEEKVATARARHVAKDVSPDGEVTIEAQTIPTGVSRVDVPHQDGATNLDIASPIDADIAIVDTGIADIPDLNVVGGHNCVGSDPNAWQDDNGHGSHVAGIAAAIDNNQGVVGVAPGARLWAVKVLNKKGEGKFSDVVCGLDWVADHSDTIDVVNLSLSGSDKTGNCDQPALHKAVCAVVDDGVTVVVAAGNQSVSANKRVPAAYDQVITVSGIADSDGKPGSLGPKPCFAKKDDRFLNFTNYGAAVDIAAPGGCILSYNDDGSLIKLSGTSQASPHVAGAAADFVALYQADNGTRPTPDQVRTWLLTEASRPQSVDGVKGDPDSKKEKRKRQQEQQRKGKKKHKGGKGKHHKHKQLKDGPREPVLWLQVLATP